MTKDDIKKALEICNDINLTCNYCPYDSVGNCNETLCADALKLITEQEKEIERLQEENCELTKRLEARLTCDFVKTAQKQAKIDVLNKAKERIKTAIDTYFNLDGGGYYLAEGAIDDIDELIEEVQNGEDKS